MSLLNREALLKKQELQIEKVEFPDGTYVYVREMNGRERDLFERSLLEEVTERDGSVTYKQSMNDFRAKISVNTICDENGVNLLRPTDYRELSDNMSAAYLDKIATTAQKLNKMSGAEKEDVLKNSSPDQSDNSTSESGGK